MLLIHAPRFGHARRGVLESISTPSRVDLVQGVHYFPVIFEKWLEQILLDHC